MSSIPVPSSTAKLRLDKSLLPARTVSSVTAYSNADAYIGSWAEFNKYG